MAGDKKRFLAKSRMFRRVMFKSFKVSRKRAAIAFCSVIIGAAVVAALASVYFDISIKMGEELRTYGANFFIAGDGSHDDKGGLDQTVYEQVVGEIPPGKLVGATPYLYGVVRLDLGNAVLAGVDFQGLKKISPFWQVEGGWIAVGFDVQNCMVGRSLAENMELKVGSRVTLSNNDTGFREVLVVKGIVETGQAEDEQVFVNLGLAQKILAKPGEIDHAMLSIVAQDFDIDGFAKRVESGYRIDAKPIRKISNSEGMILGKIKGLMALVAVIILITTTFCLMTTLMAMVVERTKEIGLMKAIGAENKDIVSQFLAEIGIIGFGGAVVGILSGFGLAQILGQAVFGSYISLRLVVLPITLGITIVAALTAAVVPVKHAVRVVPAQVLRGE